MIDDYLIFAVPSIYIVIHLNINLANDYPLYIFSKVLKVKQKKDFNSNHSRTKTRKGDNYITIVLN